MVLTQLRTGLVNFLRGDVFPYHYGSHATCRTRKDRRNQASGFHTTMVLTQPTVEMAKVFKEIMFPYHYGSHATIMVGEEGRGRELFPYHYGSHATPCSLSFSAAAIRFHTTMVLTQRLHLNILH